LVNNGTATNSGLAVRGNNSISLNGTTQYLSGTIEGINNNSWSVSCWLYSKTSPTNKGCVISFGSSVNTGAILFLGFANNTYYMDFFNDSSSSTTSFSGDINNWVHIVFMYDANSKQKMIYRNGVKLTLNNPTTTITSFSVNTNFYISKMNYDGRYYEGYIDDLRIYTGVVLSQAQINEIYAGNPYYNLPTINNKYTTKTAEILNGNPVYPIIWYKFENPDFIGLDSMGKAHLLKDGTYAIPTYDANSFVKGNGSCKLAQLQTLKLATYNFSDIVDAITICFWIKITNINTSYDNIFHGNQPHFYLARNGNGSNFELGFFGSGYQVGVHFNGLFTNDSIWKHFTLTIEKSGTATKITSYLNGVFNATSTSGTWSISGITPFYISTPSFSMIGNLDDMRFYNKVLNQAEINDVYSYSDPRTLYQFEVVDAGQKIISHY
jgi:hypothetical protein